MNCHFFFSPRDGPGHPGSGDRGPSGLGLDRSVPSFGHAVSSDKQGLQAETWAGQDQKKFLCWPGQKLTPGTQRQQTKSVTSLDLDAPDSQVTQVSQGSLIAPAGATQGSYPVSVPHPEHLLMLAQAGPTCSLGLSMKEAGELVQGCGRRQRAAWLLVWWEGGWPQVRPAHPLYQRLKWRWGTVVRMWSQRWQVRCV